MTFMKIPSNNHRLESGVGVRNGVMLQAFEWFLDDDGKHYERITHLAYTWMRMGITSVWLPPASKGAGGIHDVGYGVYDLYDLGEFDQKGSIRTKYGTLADLRNAVRILHAAAMQVIGDTVLNHRMGGDTKEAVFVTPVSSNNRLCPIGEMYAAEAYTGFTFPGRQNKYSSFAWDHSCFTGVDYAEPGKDHAIYLLDGKQWGKNVDQEYGNYDYLMGCDVDLCNPRILHELTHWAQWFLQKTHEDGFRLDAVKHMDASFFPQLLRQVRERSGKEVYAVGEYWNSNIDALLHYLDETEGCMDLFDVPLHFHFVSASRSCGTFDMRTLFDNTLTSIDPMHSVTFVDNHDTQPEQSLESWVDGWFKASAYAFILLREAGYPCVFWGDLYGIPHSGIGPVTELPLLLRLRKYCAYGIEHDYLDDPHIIGFTREGTECIPGSGIAVLCTNALGGSKSMYVGKAFAEKTFRCIIGGQTDVSVDANGIATFCVRDGGLSIYIPVSSPQTYIARFRQSLSELIRFSFHSIPAYCMSLLNHALKG